MWRVHTRIGWLIGNSWSILALTATTATTLEQIIFQRKTNRIFKYFFVSPLSFGHPIFTHLQNCKIRKITTQSIYVDMQITIASHYFLCFTFYVSKFFGRYLNCYFSSSIFLVCGFFLLCLVRNSFSVLERFVLSFPLLFLLVLIQAKFWFGTRNSVINSMLIRCNATQRINLKCLCWAVWSLRRWNYTWS